MQAVKNAPLFLFFIQHRFEWKDGENNAIGSEICCVDFSGVQLDTDTPNPGQPSA